MKQKAEEGILALPEFDYEEVSIRDLKCEGKYDKKGQFSVEKVVSQTRSMQPSQRFWDSLCSRFGFGPSIFRYFSHSEVFDRISEKVGDQNNADRIKLTIQRTAGDDEYIDKTGFEPKLLAVTSPDKSMIHNDEVVRVLNRLGAEEVNYRDGIIVSKHNLRRDVGFDIGGDKHTARFSLETPIDGYGRPNIFLSLLRQICSNGAIGYSKAFQSGIILGKGTSAAETLERAMEAYNNEDGFVAMKDRLLSAQNSWASVFECVKLAKTMWKLNNKDFKPSFVRKSGEAADDKSGLRNRLMSKLYESTGDLRAIYGVAQVDSISEKRMRQLPSKARVYDLLCYATEIATHQLRPESARQLQGYFGTMIGTDIYDLEGSCDEYPDFTDFTDPSSKEVVDAEKAEQN